MVALVLMSHNDITDTIFKPQNARVPTLAILCQGARMVLEPRLISRDRERRPHFRIRYLHWYVRWLTRTGNEHGSGPGASVQSPPGPAREELIRLGMTMVMQVERGLPRLNVGRGKPSLGGMEGPWPVGEGLRGQGYSYGRYSHYVAGSGTPSRNRPSGKG